MLRWTSITTLSRAVAVAAAASSAACGGSPTSPAAQRSTYVLSGVVTETTADGRAPVEGAVISHLGGGKSAMTDSSGAYAIPDAPAGFGSLSATKDGYTVAMRFVTLNADARVDFELARPASPPPVGPYVLSGTVYEQTPAGRVPLEGVRLVEVYRDLVTTTDSGGRYRFSMDLVQLGQYDSFLQLSLTRDGFQTRIVELVLQAADTQLDFDIVRR